MTTPIDVRNAVNDRIVTAYPDWIVYLGAVPKNFRRPSVLLEIPQATVQSANAKLVEVTVSLTLTLIPDTDDYHMTDPDALFGFQCSVIDLFRDGRLPVGDRVLTIAASTGGMDYENSVAFVDISTTFFDLRSEAADPEPLMNKFKLTIKEE